MDRALDLEISLRTLIIFWAFLLERTQNEGIDDFRHVLVFYDTPLH